MALLPMLASAYDAKIDGIYYNFSGNEATVTRDNYSSNAYSDDVVIPPSVTYNGRTYNVTSIGKYAFEYCTGLISVTIPNRVRLIGDSAFSGCISLTSINIPNSVTSIGIEAFRDCSGLTTIIIPNSVTSMANNAFSGCFFESEYFTNNSSLTSTSYGGATLCDEETGDGILIKDNAVKRCRPWATIVTIPNSVTSIDNQAFSYCNSLTSVTIPEGVTSIGGRAFQSCSSLTSINIPNSVTSIDGYAFSDCSSLISFIIPEGLTRITASTFMGCSSLTSVIIPNSVKHIDENAFRNCISLTSVTIPNRVTSIYQSAFQDCRSLTSITIPNSVTDIGGSVFSGCYFVSENFINNSTLTSSNNFGATLVDEETGDGLLIKDNAVKRCRPWATIVTIPNSVTTIGQYAFRDCSGLTSITIPNSVTSIKEYAFANCTGLTSVTIPNSVKIISQATFSGCSSLTSVTIPCSVRLIGDSAFSGCSSLTSVTIPNTVTSIWSSAFYGCSSLTSVVSKIVTPFQFEYNAFDNISSNCVLTVPMGTRDAYIAAGWTTSVFYGGIVEEDFEETIAVGSSGYATFCSPYALDFSEVSDIKAYIASGFNPATGTLVLTRVTEVPSGEGLYIVGTPREYEVPKTTTSMFYSNLLKGVTEATNISPTEGNMTNFILANGSHGIGFYTLSQSGELAAGKAYLQLPTASVSNVKALHLLLDDEGEDDATSLNEELKMKNEESGASIYNLAGQRLSKAQKGINIVDGKKVFIK